MSLSINPVRALQEACCIAHKMYSLDGFEKAVKAVIPTIALIRLFPGRETAFSGCASVFEEQKNLYYATKIFSTPADYLTKRRDGNYAFGVPLHKRKFDWEKILLGFGSIFETAKFLKKNKLCNFTMICNLSTRIGNASVFGKIIENKFPAVAGWTLNDVPGISRFLSAPKDVCVFLACVHGMYKVSQLPSKQFWTVETFVKIVGNMGKIILIGAGGLLKARGYNWLVVVIDFTYSNTVLFGALWKCHLAYHGVKGQ